MPYPLPLTRTEAYLAYKAGVIQQSDLKPSLAVPRNGIDAWLAYWTGLAEDYPKREDGTPHILQEEEAYVAYLCGVINEYPEKCLRRVGAYLRYLISARWGRPDHPLNREELYLSLIKTQFIPSGDPSSDIVIDGTAKAPFVDVKMYGDTYQQSYTGKNIFATGNFDYTNGGIRSIGSNGVINSSGTLSQTWGFNIYGGKNLIPSGIIPAGTYTVSITKAVAFPFILGLVAEDNTTTIGNYTIPVGSTSYTFTTDQPAKYFTLWSNYANHSGEQISVTDLSIMIESGSLATSYEPYVGGVPSPSPSYPQQIQTVTGEQTVSVNGTDYPISLGSIELCKLGDYQDYIYKSGDDWKVHKATVSVELNGTENWYNSSSAATYPFYVANIFDKIGASIQAVNAGEAYFSHFSIIGQILGSNEYIGACLLVDNPNSFANVRVRLSDMSSGLESFKTMLSNKKPLIYAKKATPTDTVITNQALIDQLNALKQGGAEEGTTYIRVSATDPNLPAKLYVEAPKYD